jgi:hypothetical protein
MIFPYTIQNFLDAAKCVRDFEIRLILHISKGSAMLPR